VTTLVPPPFSVLGPYYIYILIYIVPFIPPSKDGEGIQRKKRRRGHPGLLKSRPTASVSWTESERPLPLYLLSSTLGLIILLQQSKLRNESNGNLGLCPLGRFFFPKRAKVCGRKNSKRREESTKRDRVRPLSNWRFSLISWGSISSENFSCSISIAKFE
jgi:hypothetical protein